MKSVVHGIRFGIVFAFGDRDLRFQPLLLLVFLAQLLQGAGYMSAGNIIAGVKLGNRLNFFVTEAWLAGDADLANVRDFTGSDIENNVRLLRLVIKIVDGRDLRHVVAVSLHHALHWLNTALHLRLVK